VKFEPDIRESDISAAMPVTEKVVDSRTQSFRDPELRLGIPRGKAVDISRLKRNYGTGPVEAPQK